MAVGEMKPISEVEIDAFRAKTRKLSNRGRFKEVLTLARRYLKKYPHVLMFAYVEAVYTAEDTSGLTPKEADKAYASAARKLKKLIPRSRSASPRLRRSIRNEYYWFSKQPRKQYQLGLRYGRDGLYSVGVGAAQLARQYGNQGRRKLCLRWAKVSERAWLDFFAKVEANWSNSYQFYAMALAYQGRSQEMEKALARCAKIARKPKSWLVIKELHADIDKTLAKLKD